MKERKGTCYSPANLLRLFAWVRGVSILYKNFLCVPVFIPFPLFLGDRCDWRSGKAAHSLNQSQRNTHRQCAHTVGFWLQASLTTAQLPLFQGTPQHAVFLSPSHHAHAASSPSISPSISVSLSNTWTDIRKYIVLHYFLFSFVKCVITKILGNNPLHLN